MNSFLFSKLVDVYEALEKITSGNAMRAILAELFKKVPRDEIDMVAYLTLGKIASDYEEIVLGMAEKMVLKTIALSAGESEKKVHELYKKKGDIGLVAEELSGAGQTPLVAKKALTIRSVFEGLHKIAAATGTGSQEAKMNILLGLLRNASPKEAKYIVRIVLGTLRLGVGDMTVLDSLAIAFTGTKANKALLEHAYNICPDVGIIAKTIATKGLAGIKKIGVVVGRPIQMMLSQRIKTLEEVQKHMPWPVAVEEKYDGERIQVHKDGSKVTLYSRRLENITSQFPDIVEAILRTVSAKSCVIEGEACPIDDKGNLLPFQVLMQRRRKYEIEKYVKKIPVTLFLFDILYLNGRSLINESYPNRYKELTSVVKPSKAIQFANRSLCYDIDCIENLFQKVLEHGGEGVMIKSTAQEAVYQAGTRGWLWIKWKPEYAKELADTFDLVVIGAFHGRGKRSGSYGALLCAAYNEKLDRFESFCKLGSGFTDADLEEMPKLFKKYVVQNKPARVEVSKLMVPDVWFEPRVVVEVIGAEITRSPTHTTAMEHGQGLALRFPRFVRYRNDKKPEQATTSVEILQMYQKRVRQK
ncbi:MAG: ATP-dependent DNA ligase [Candidatus Woesearchaeota archaeon]